MAHSPSNLGKHARAADSDSEAEHDAYDSDAIECDMRSSKRRRTAALETAKAAAIAAFEAVLESLPLALHRDSEYDEKVATVRSALQGYESEIVRQEAAAAADQKEESVRYDMAVAYVSKTRWDPLSAGSTFGTAHIPVLVRPCGDPNFGYVAVTLRDETFTCAVRCPDTSQGVTEFVQSETVAKGTRFHLVKHRMDDGIHRGLPPTPDGRTRYITTNSNFRRTFGDGPARLPVTNVPRSVSGIDDGVLLHAAAVDLPAVQHPGDGL
jgi:hypothetical protein